MNKIAKWYNNKKCAISMRFDDASESHIKKVLPILDSYGLKATFMVNPGRYAYKKYKVYWEKIIPEKNHNIGNHTWNHKGAKTLKDAKKEIGTVSHLIWKLYPTKSKLNVFASGGGEKWGGRLWSKADSRFKKILEDYYLIDLYNGEHPCIYADTKIELMDLLKSVDKTINDGIHQPYTFHQIRKPYSNIESILRLVIKGYDISITEKKYEQFVDYVYRNRKKIWIGTLLDVLKYETQYKNIQLVLIEKSENKLIYNLISQLDSRLYDHPLTLVLGENDKKSVKVKQFFHNKKYDCPVFNEDDRALSNIQCVNSHIVVDLH